MASTGAVAQDAANAKTGKLEEIIVTGSFIRGTPEDTALPVEVITQEELEEMGRPSNMDLVKTLSEVGQVAGEAYRYNSYPVGAATINLRNLGARYTTVIFNGRRFPEQYSATTGRFNNINWIPNAAVGSVEVLKEGGAVTYGADAVGGVVNYKTRRNVDGLELHTDYRYIEDSDGDYTADAVWGTQFDRGNFMVVGAYQHRSYLAAIDRDFTNVGPLENRTVYNWVASGSPGSYAFVQSGGVLGQGTTGAITPLSGYTGNRQMSVTGIVRDPNCNALGGFSGWSSTPSPVCYMRVGQWEQLVDKQDQYQLYSELNYDLTDRTQLHVEAMYYLQDLPEINTYPSDLPLSSPLVAGTGATQMLGTSPVYYVSGHNPAVAQFLNNFYNADGTTTAYTPTQINNVLTNGRAALVYGTWRPFGNGGNPIYGEHDIQHNSNEMYRLTTQLDGQFGDSTWNWQVAGSYSHVKYSVETDDMLVDRLQAALNGFGGANCNGIEAGQAGSTCQWLNPFSSAIERNIYVGGSNPGYVPGLANDPDLIRWLYVPIELNREYDYFVLDSLVTGDLPWSLPGGAITLAGGVQYRYTGEEFTVDDLSNRDINPCATIGQMTCNSQTGPLAFTRNSTVLGTTRNTKRHYPVVAAYAEAQFPILDSLSLQVAARYEKFFSDVTDNDNDVVVPAAAIKWQATDWLGVRASAGKTFSQVNPPEDDGPTIAIGATNPTFGGISGYTTAGYDNVDVKPVEGDYFSTGFLVQLGNFHSNIDYYSITLNEFTRTMTANSVLASFLGPTAQATDLLNCSSDLLNPQAGFNGQGYIQLANPCVQGASTVADIGTGSTVNYFAGTDMVNSGKLKTNGIDLSMGYDFENVFGGTLTPSIDATYVLDWELGDFVLNGVTVAEGYDGVGYKNSGSGRLNLAIPEYRGSIGLRYRNGRHTLNILATYLPSIKNDDEGDFDRTNDQNANVGDANGVVTTGVTAGTAACVQPGPAGGLTTDLGNVPAGAGTGQFGSASVQTPTPSTLIGFTRGFCGSQNAAILSGQEIESNTNVDLTYVLQLTDAFTMSFSVYNLFNEEPSFDRASLAYNPGFGSPLLRNYKLSFTAKF